MPTKIVRLLSGGFTAEQHTEISEDILEKPVMLVYTGKFDSMDGPVEVTDQHIEALAENHNSALARLKRLASGEIPLKHCPPIQLDHSVSARDTVGRLVGDLTVGEYDDAGEKKKALLGKVRILGRENVEKVKDGRWTNVSIGADFDQGKISELTITPFPAAPNASLLSKPNNLQGDDMDKAKLKKYLMDEKKMSEADADKHLAALADEECKKLAAEVDDHDKKLAAAEDEKKKLAAEESEKKEKELTAKKLEMVRLGKDMRASGAAAALAAKKTNLSSRLSKLRAAAKVTPAELKKLNLTELSSKSDEALDLFFKGFEAREPQVLPGMAGTTSAAEIATVARNKKVSNLAKQVRGDMPFLSQVTKNRLAEEEGGEDTVNIHVDTDPHTDMTSDEDVLSIEKMMDEDLARAKQMFREYCRKMKSRMTSDGATNEMGEQEEKAKEELVNEMKKLQTHNEQLLKLVGEMTGEQI